MLRPLLQPLDKLLDRKAAWRPADAGLVAAQRCAAAHQGALLIWHRLLQQALQHALPPGLLAEALSTVVALHVVLQCQRRHQRRDSQVLAQLVAGGSEASRQAANPLLQVSRGLVQPALEPFRMRIVACHLPELFGAAAEGNVVEAAVALPHSPLP